MIEMKIHYRKYIVPNDLNEINLYKIYILPNDRNENEF